MSQLTKIEWTDMVWNFIRGCSRVSEGCRNCYAEGVAARFSGQDSRNGGVLPYFGLAKFVDHQPRWTGEISFHEEVLLQPLKWTKPRKIFVNSMSDLFHEKVTDEMLDKAFAVMALTPQHTYQILTKRPERMKAYFDADNKKNLIERWAVACDGFGLSRTGREDDDDYLAVGCDMANRANEQWPLPNVWLGVSVEDQKTADERIPLLLQTPAAVRWISAEPLLGPINFGRIPIDIATAFAIGPHSRLDWVVVGGESGPYARECDISNIRSIVEQCKAADVPVFTKQLGSKPFMGVKGFGPLIKNKKGGDINEWPTDLQIRQFPKVSASVESAN